MIHVVVAEDMGLLRSALCAALSSEEDIEVIADAADVGELWSVLRRERPDVLVLDLKPEFPESAEVVAKVVAEAPGTAVLAMSHRWSPPLVEAALAAGARGLVSKDVALSELVRAVRTTAAGERVIDPSAAVAVLSPPVNPLTRREQEVLRAAAEGVPLKEIARRLYLAHGTVRNHLSAILHKTGARNRMEAVRVAQREGWL
ncbi:response regulator transcription factor [Micromonospora carbonacea]|uniref:response regulator transcription factor n=1 Tax=Micromonospora carbonacea TaxID=47853 RepID=UPI0017C7EFCB|nr:response regulator transcription factor [Micromonospora carbonacea]MBB5826966.1 two-component system response regulator DesR [Micromonospora carbonacea]